MEALTASHRILLVELALVARQLWERKRLLLVGLLIATIAAGWSLYRVTSLLPPKFQARPLEYSAATTSAFVDLSESLVANPSVNVGQLDNLATVYANLMASPGLVRLIGEYARIPGDQIWAAGPVDPALQRVMVEPTAQKRNVQIAGETRPYRISFYADPNLPILDVYAQAPSTGQAISLANATIQALKTFVRGLQDKGRTPTNGRVLVRQVGQPSASVVDAGIRQKLGALVFFATFVGWCVLVLVGIRARTYWRASGVPSHSIDPRDDIDDWVVGHPREPIESEPAIR